jgi:hypothetical protein
MEDTQRLVTEIEMLKVVLRLVRRNMSEHTQLDIVDNLKKKNKR